MDLLDPLIYSETVRSVHNIVADRQFGETCDLASLILRPVLLLSLPLYKNIRLRDLRVSYERILESL